jgi:hypothetical protein
MEGSLKDNNLPTEEDLEKPDWVEGETSEITHELHKLQLVSTYQNDPISKNVDVRTLFQNFFNNILIEFLNKPYSDKTGDTRQEDAGKAGGIELKDHALASMMRKTGWDLVKQIGRKILSGDFNLTTIGLPIKIMMPLTILQTIAECVFNLPIYFSLAHYNKDPLEKFKWVIVACHSNFHKSSYFIKPVF